MILFLSIALIWPLSLFLGPEEPYPEPLRTVWVDSPDTLEQAIQDIQPGDHVILRDGIYHGIKLDGLRGTRRHPLVFSAEHSRQAVVKGSKGSRNLSISGSAYVYLYGIRFTQAPIWGVTIGPAYSEDKNHRGSRNIRLIDCEVDHAGQALIRINGNSRSIEIRDCEIHDSGQLKHGRRPYAEGIYVGDGTRLNDRSHDILIQNNEIYRIGNDRHGGEAIDIKCRVYDVRIIGNRIREVCVYTGGAITVLFDSVDYPFGRTNPKVVVEGNQIDGVRHQPKGSNAAGICVGANGVLIKNNTVKNTKGPAFLSYSHAANTRGFLRVYGNKFFGVLATGTYDQGRREVVPVIDARRNLIQPAGGAK